MTTRRKDILICSAAIGVLTLAVWKLYLRKQKRVKQSEDYRNALLAATHQLEGFTAKLAASIREGSLSVAEGVDQLANDSVKAVLGPLKRELMTSMEPDWIFARHLIFDITRLACMPRVPQGKVKYVEFATGDTHVGPCPPPRKDATRCIVVSDTHMRHRDMDMPSGDVLLHCGDIFNFGGDPEPTSGEAASAYQQCFDDFLNWMRDLRDRCPEVVFIGGNHDRHLESTSIEEIQKQLPPFVKYLDNTDTNVAGDLRVYGTPFSYTWRKSGNCAFQTGDPNEIRDIMDGIPEHLDVLMTHGPPQIPAEAFGLKTVNTNTGMIDFAGWGSIDLSATVQNRAKPRVHVFGHVHDAHGASRIRETLYISASSVASYKTTAENPPIVVDVPRRHC